MKKVSFLIVVFLSIVFILNWSCVFEFGDQTDMSYNNLKAISLRSLQNHLYDNNPEKISEIKSFYGFTKLYGFVYDKENTDIILIGEADNNEPLLNFDDFVVSLKNQYCFYCENRNDTLFYDYPSCTIDPDTEILDSLNKLSISKNSKNSNFDHIQNNWENICSAPQRVGVFGIPMNCKLSSKMVNADYLLKDLANGSVEISNDNFRSLHAIRREKVDLALKSNIKTIDLGSPVNRFEITSPKAYFKSSNSLHLLYKMPVVLITEEEYKAKETYKGTGKSDSMAQEFTDNFNKYYTEISEQLPIYDSLQQSYRIYAVAKAIYESDLISDTAFFRGLFHYYSIDNCFVPDSVPGKSLVDKIEYSDSLGTTTQFLYSCGGVSFRTEIISSPINLMKEQEIINSVITTKPYEDSDVWKPEREKENEKEDKKKWVLQINFLSNLINTKN